ncbi:Hypothetical predicted protein, partial [Pelobates cultripes]
FFYYLPKIHKRLENPPGRPIISGIGSLTSNISQYVDFFLQQRVMMMCVTSDHRGKCGNYLLNLWIRRQNRPIAPKCTHHEIPTCIICGNAADQFLILYLCIVITVRKYICELDTCIARMEEAPKVRVDWFWGSNSSTCNSVWFTEFDGLQMNSRQMP